MVQNDFDGLPTAVEERVRLFVAEVTKGFAFLEVEGYVRGEPCVKGSSLMPYTTEVLYVSSKLHRRVRVAFNPVISRNLNADHIDVSITRAPYVTAKDFLSVEEFLEMNAPHAFARLFSVARASLDSTKRIPRLVSEFSKHVNDHLRSILFDGVWKNGYVDDHTLR
jgi:hypothetical protein